MSILFSNNKIKFFFLILVLLIAFYKSPFIFINGRFVAEEGSFFFRNSYIYGSIIGLFQINFDYGYFNFWANLSSVVATFVPLEYAPLITVYFAFAVKIYLFVFILFQNSDLFDKLYQKLISVIIILASPPMVAEVWLNTLTSQVYFTILSIFIFFQRENKSILANLSPIVLLIASLSTLTTCILTPFFLIKYLIKRSKNNLINFFAILFGTFAQLIIYVYIQIQNLELSGRYFISFEKIVSFTYNVIVKSLFGRDLTQYIYFNYLENLNLVFLSLLILILISTFFFFITKNAFKNKTLLFLLLIFLTECLLSFLGAKDDQVQGRYALLPSIILLLILVKSLEDNKLFIKILSFLFIFISITTGFYEYKNNNKYPQFLLCLGCPDWKEEVSKWKNDINYELKIWDYSTQKKMNLKK